MGNHDCHSPGSNPSHFENRNRDIILHSIGRETETLTEEGQVQEKNKYRRDQGSDHSGQSLVAKRERESGLRLCWLFRDDQMASRRILMLLLLSAMLAGFSETSRFLLLFIRRKENDASLLSQSRTHSEREKQREKSLILC